MAWLAGDLTTTVLGDDGTTLQPARGRRRARSAPIARRRATARTSTPDGYGCTAYLNGEQAAEVYLADSHGQSAPLGGALLAGRRTSPPTAGWSA